MRNKLDVASTSGTMLSIKRTRNDDSSEKRFSTGRDAPLVPHLGDGLKPRSNRGSKSLRQNLMDTKSEDESFKSNERQKSEHTHKKLLI